MDFGMTEEQSILRDSILKFATAELNVAVRERDRAHSFDRRLWEKCGGLRLPGLPIDVEAGGAGADPLTTAIALEALGTGCSDGGLVFSICAHMLACVVPIWKHGSPEQREKYLPRLCDGRLIAVNAMTESGTGSDAFAMSTRAVRDGEGFRITGTKTFCSNAPVADLAVVYALTDAERGFHGGVTAFLVEHGTPGLTRGQQFEKLGLRTSPIGELVFDEVLVGPDAVLGRVGSGAAIFAESMDWERALLGACHLGTMQRLLNQAIDYARTRKQYGQTIGKFQAVSHRISNMKVRLEAARLLVYYAASRLGRARDASLNAAISKLFVSESLVQSALDTVQVLGGYGFMTEYDAERILRDAVGSTIYSGTSDIQRNIIARWLGL
jgi:alkylation response protein AidB-like acyl-CoA dehydrogenase